MFKYRSIKQIRLSKLAAANAPGLLQVPISSWRGRGVFAVPDCTV